MSRAYLVAGLGFGDEGKGTITQYLAQERGANLVVRYNGGAQAAHNVYAEDGRHHTFAQFGSATFEGKPTHLSRFMMVEPHALFAEGRHLVSLGIPDPYKLLTVNERALLITPFHWSANRLREAQRASARHGSCGIGIGETMQYSLAHGEDAPVIGDLRSPTELTRKLSKLQEKLVEELVKPNITDISLPDAAHRAMQRLMDPIERVVESYAGMLNIIQLVGDDFLKKHCAESGSIVFEGAQGVLLDQDYGFHPYTTWSDITFANAYKLLEEADVVQDYITKVGVTRSYSTRHGAGPLPTEIKNFDKTLDNHNGRGLWQGDFRIGPLDLMLLSYAVKVLGGVDEIALTHCDQIQEFDRLGIAYRVWEEPDFEFFEPGGVRVGGTLKVKKTPDLDYQAKLTTMLSRVSPVFMPGPTNAQYMSETLSADLNAPVTIFSNGPELKDKTSVAP